MTQLTLLEQRQAAAEALRAADHQRASDYHDLVTSEPALALLTAAQALHDPNEAPPAGGGVSINKLIGFLLSTLGSAPTSAQALVAQLAAPVAPPAPPPIP